MSSACRFSSQALEAATLVAERVREPEHVLAVAENAVRQSSITLLPHPASTVFGVGGIALPCTYFAQCFPDQGWDKIAHHYLEPQKQPHPLNGPGLYSMTSGMALIVSLLSENGKRYRKTLDNLHTLLCDQVAQLPTRPDGSNGVAEREYDLVSGVTGVLAYLLTLIEPGEQERAAAERLLTYLIDLAGIDQASGRHHWYVAQQFIVMPDRKKDFPEGYYNCGLAHGIPGPLAVLALAWQAGYRTAGLYEAISTLSNWLLQHSVVDNWGINWPDVVPIPQSHTREEWKMVPATRAAWCYGAPGIARALWFAGLTLEDTSLCQTALEAMEAVLRRPIAVRGIDSPILCHGIAGLLAICLRFYHDTRRESIGAHIPLLVSQILSHFNPEYPLGFRDLETATVSVDWTNWLTGSPGTALALLAAALPVEPQWDRIMLLS